MVETGTMTVPGVYARDRAGQLQLVHMYQLGEYRLADVLEMFGLGRIEADEKGGALILTASEARQLKMLTDAYGFDNDPEFTEMCYALHRFVQEQGIEEARFTANF